MAKHMAVKYLIKIEPIPTQAGYTTIYNTAGLKMNATEWELEQIGDEVVLKDSSENKPVNPLTTDRQVLFLDGDNGGACYHYIFNFNSIRI